MSAMPMRARVAPVAPARRAGRACPSARHARHVRASSDARGAVASKLPRRAALALSGAASLATGAAALGASAGASPTPSPASSTAFARSGAARNRVVFDDARVAIPGSGQSVPVATWFPDASGAGAAAPSAISDRRDPTSSPLYYPHAISVAKIARVLLNTPESTPRWLDRQTPLLAAPGVRFAARGETSSATAAAAFGKVAVLCHGYLGSRFDLVDLAEALAREGFLVLASEFAESLASPETTPAYARPGAPPPANPSATRDEVVDAALRAFAPGFFEAQASGSDERRPPRVVIAGQSAGASTATSARGPFAARVAIAGFRPPPPESLEAREALTRDPLLVVASAGDGVISLYPRESGAFGAYEGIAASVESMPARVPKYDVEEFAARVREMGTLNDADARRRAKETSGNALNAFLTYEPPGGDGGAMDGLPCHISFLSSRTNDAMVEVLSPLLPVARAIGVPVLDFDKYQTTRDSDAVNAELVPLIAEWLNAAVERR